MQQNPNNSPLVSTPSAQTTPTFAIRPPPPPPPLPPPPPPYNYLMERHNDLLRQLSLDLKKYRSTLVEVDTLRLQNSQLRLHNDNLKACNVRLTADNVELRGANMRLVEENIKLWHSMYVQQVPKWFSFYADPSRSAIYFGESSKATEETSKEEELWNMSASDPTEIALNLCDVKGIHVQGEYGPIEHNGKNQGSPKTEMCKTWRFYGSCPYDDRCKFAHGIADLLPIIRPHNYKTNPCLNIMKGDPCPYEDRCQYRHNLTDEEKLQVVQSHD